MKRILRWALLGFLLLMVVGGVLLYFTFNGMLRSTIETQATRSLELPTSLASARLSLLGGRFTMGDLAIANPQGFSDDSLLSLGGARVKVNYGDLDERPLRIREIVLDRPRLLVEHREGKFNFQVLTQRDPVPSPTPPTEPAEPLKLIIETLTISDASVVLRPGIPGLADEVVVPVPSVTLNSVGTGEGNQNGAEIKRVVGDVVTSLAGQAAASDQLPEDVRKLLSLNVEQLKLQLQRQITTRVNEALDELTRQLPPEVQQQIPGPARERINDAIGDLLKAPKKEGGQ